MATAADRNALAAIAGACHSAQQDALAPMSAAIRARHGTSVQALIYYGSCLRAGNPYEGLLDFYVVVSSYSAAHRHAVSALANRCLPPNVYYLECDGGAGRLRCKYAVIRMDDLENGIAHGLLSGLWGRFAQPVAIIDANDADTERRLRACCGQAVLTLLNETLPVLSPPSMPAEVFGAALALSYGGELRAESRNRARELAEHDRAEYARRTHAARPYLELATELGSDGRLCWRADRASARRAARRWQLRRPLGRAISVLRLAKACFTFDNAVDYGAWKLARHTGVHIEVTARLRRYPLIYAWPLLWRLYRQGVLR